MEASGGGEPTGGLSIAEQVRNDEVRSERQLGLVVRVSGTWETVLLIARLGSASHFPRDPGVVLSPLCAIVSSFGLNLKPPPTPFFKHWGQGPILRR